jgi:hypothetical protein
MLGSKHRGVIAKGLKIVGVDVTAEGLVEVTPDRRRTSLHVPRDRSRARVNGSLQPSAWL